MAAESEYGKSEVFYAHQVEFMVGQSHYNVRNVLSSCDQEFVLDQHTRFERLTSIMEILQDGLLYGDESRQLRPLAKISSSHFQLFMKNGCVDNRDELYTMADCKHHFYDGIVGKGLQAAYKEYVALAQKTIDERHDAVLAENCTLADANAGTPRIMEQLAERYLSVGFMKASELTTSMINDSLKGFQAIDIVVTVGSLLALVVFYFAVYSPMIRRLDREIKNVRELLLLFPDELAKIVPAIVQAGKDLLREGHTSSNSSVASEASARDRIVQ